MIKFTGCSGVDSGSVHAGIAQDFDKLAAEGADVLLYLVDVILSDAAALGASLLYCHVPSHQVPHYSLSINSP